jgi:hypothetical protein
MHGIEGVIDELNSPLAVSRRLCIGEARQASLINTTEFAIDVSGLDIQVRERCGGARIFEGPVQAGPG